MTFPIYFSNTRQDILSSMKNILTPQYMRRFHTGLKLCSLIKKGEANSGAALPPASFSISSPKTTYKSQLKHSRLTYESSYEPLDEEEMQSRKTKNRPFRTYYSMAALVGGSLWLMFSYRYFFLPNEEKMLSPDKFSPYVITFKHQIDESHYMIELSRKDRGKFSSREKSMWNGKFLWSIEIKQPEINIVRKYTPLPLVVSSVEKGKPFFRIIDSPQDEGKMCLYVKTYDTGEMGRYIARQSLFSELEIRGPFVDFQFPSHPLDKEDPRPTMRSVPSMTPGDSGYGCVPQSVICFAGGTGIAPFMQTLLSQDPPKGFFDIYFSSRTEGEVGPLSVIFNLLSVTGRAKIHHFVGNAPVGDIPKPADGKIVASKDTKKYENALQQHFHTRDMPKPSPSLALVCGPEGYVEYICGRANFNNAANRDLGKVGGLLKDRGWSEKNVVRLS